MPPLAPGWSLGADDQQWEVLRSRQRQDEAYHQAVAFVGSTKTVLLRVLRGNGVQPTPDAQARLDALPERFLDWRHSQGLRTTTQSAKQPPVGAGDCDNFVTLTSLKDHAHG